jgi:hypothetical protein
MHKATGPDPINPPPPTHPCTTLLHHRHSTYISSKCGERVSGSSIDPSVHSGRHDAQVQGPAPLCSCRSGLAAKAQQATALLVLVELLGVGKGNQYSDSWVGGVSRGSRESSPQCCPPPPPPDFTNPHLEPHDLVEDATHDLHVLVTCPRCTASRRMEAVFCCHERPGI